MKRNSKAILRRNQKAKSTYKLKRRSDDWGNNRGSKLRLITRVVLP